MNEFLDELRSKYDYDDETLEMIGGIIPSIIEVFGEENIEKIKNAFLGTKIIFYDTVSEANELLEQYFKDGRKNRVSKLATGGGFFEDDVKVVDDQIVSYKSVIGISKGSKEKALSTLTHEISHLVSSRPPYLTENGTVVFNTGFSCDEYEIVNGSKGKIIRTNGKTIINEIITENISMQILDLYDSTIEHEATAYIRRTNSFRTLFRNEELNSLFISDYQNGTQNITGKLSGMIDDTEYGEILSSFFSYNLNDEQVSYINKLKSMSVPEFINNTFFSQERDPNVMSNNGIDIAVFEGMNQAINLDKNL